MREARVEAARAMSQTTPHSLLGFDFGMRRIGVAVGQCVTGTASGLTTLTARDGQPDWNQIERLLAEWRPDALIVGLPLALDGSRTELTLAAERFARRLRGRFRLPVHLNDERLSSHAAERWTTETAPGGLDTVAARIVLQDWLDSHSGREGP